jgi:hypothetical protein
LQDEQWRKMSNREIARQTGTSHTFVAMMRDQLAPPKPLGAAELKANAQAQTFRETLTGNTGNVAMSQPVQTFKVGDRAVHIPSGRIGIIRELADDDPINSKRYPGTALLNFSREEGGHGTSHRYPLHTLALAKGIKTIEVDPIPEHIDLSPTFNIGELVTTRTGHAGTVIEKWGRIVKVKEDSGVVHLHHANDLQLAISDDEPDESDDQSVVDVVSDALTDTFQSERLHLLIPTLATVLCAADGAVEMNSSDMNTQIDMLIQQLTELKT